MTSLNAVVDVLSSHLDIYSWQPPEDSSSGRVDNLLRLIFRSSLNIEFRAADRTVRLQTGQSLIPLALRGLPLRSSELSQVRVKMEVTESELTQNARTGRMVRSIGTQIETVSSVPAPAIRRAADQGMRQEVLQRSTTEPTKQSAPPVPRSITQRNDCICQEGSQ